MLNIRKAGSVIALIAAVSLIVNVILWINLSHERDQNETLVYAKLAMNFRAQLKAAGGYVDAPDSSGDAASFLDKAVNDLDMLNDSFTARGIPHVGDISLTLSKIASDLTHPSRVSQEQLDQDKTYVKKAYALLETECYPRGKTRISAFPKAFADIYAISS